MNQPWWIPLIKPILFSLLFYLAMRVVNRRLRRRWKDDESRTLRHQGWVPILGSVAVLFGFGLAIISNTIGKNETTNIWTTSFFVGFGLLGLPLIADYLFSRHRVTEEGIDYGGMFGTQGFMAWKDLEYVSISQTMGWCILKSSSGAKARISVLLEGLPQFSRLVLEHVPRERIQMEAYLFLVQTANGSYGMLIDPNSIEWTTAVSKARSTLPILHELHETDNNAAWVKYEVKTTEGTTEHVWGELQYLGEDSFRATLETPLVTGEPVDDMNEALPLSALEDWLVTLPDGTVRGAFTMQVELEVAKREGLAILPHIAAMDGRFCDR
jgi:hypothetical protein